MAATIGRLLATSARRAAFSGLRTLVPSTRVSVLRAPPPLTCISAQKACFSISAARWAPAVTQAAPHFKGTAVLNGEFKEISLEDFKGKYLSGGLGKIHIPLLADLTKQVSRDYGVLLEGPGIALRGLFIIDPNGVIRHMSVNDLPVGRSVEETLRLVRAFQFVETHGEVCPASWTPKSPTIKPTPDGSKEYFEKVN
ncbi:hypothetical protein DNTS_035383 [Danionella cerebrum]|uniref:Thioredoxin-dependent peroxide reductase, mitochondrial n=1 Tax=Danionella cerebrum TaxID=2873325 RepID=A0A553QMI5_9TELE|nr:hypothetical protein DNTS_035383 [Danionella translucida]